MNETDLVELLRERADIPDDGHRTRVAGVRAKVRRGRRRQAAAVVVTVVLALAGVVHALPGRPTADPATPSLPAYQDGYGFVTSVSGARVTEKTSLYYTPKDDTFRLYAFCAIGHREADGIRITVNGKLWYEGVCGKHGTAIQPPADAWTAFGITFGRAIRVEASLPDPAFDTGEWGVRVGEPVPLADYPFPPRPDVLPALVQYPPEHVLARSTPADPAARHESKVRWTGVTGLELAVNSPGRVRVLVNGVEVLNVTRWTYDPRPEVVTAPVAEWPRLHGLTLVEGEEVTLTVVPERTSGEWVLTRWPDPPR